MAVAGPFPRPGAGCPESQDIGAMLHRRIAWSLAVLLFIGLLVWWFFLDPGWQVRYVEPGKRVFVLTFTFMTMTLVVPAVLAFLLALIPWPRRTYMQRVGGRLPWCLSVWLGLMAMTYARPRLMDWRTDSYCQLIAAGVQDVAVPADLDCAHLHQGRFRFNDYTLIRSGATQEEVSDAGARTLFALTWNGSCEYCLKKEGEEQSRNTVRVIALGPTWYDCVIGDSTTCALIRVQVEGAGAGSP